MAIQSQYHRSAAEVGNNPASMTVNIQPPVGHLKILTVWAKFTATVIGTPAGWTEISNNASPVSTGGRLAIFQRKMLFGDANPVVTFTGGSNGNTCLAQAFALSGFNQLNPFGPGIVGSNVAAVNIGPIQLPRWLALTALFLSLVLASDDWTSVAASVI